MNQCVADTSALIALSCVRRLDLLRAVCPAVLVPQAVFHEIVTQGVGWIEAAEAHEELRAQTWLQVTPVVASPFLYRLRTQLGGSGEAEAIALAAERQLPIYVDEIAGRRVAAEMGLEVFGSLKVLRLAKEAGLIDRVAPLLDQISTRHVYYGAALRARALKEVGEE